MKKNGTKCGETSLPEITPVPNVTSGTASVGQRLAPVGCEEMEMASNLVQQRRSGQTTGQGHAMQTVSSRKTTTTANVAHYIPVMVPEPESTPPPRAIKKQYETQEGTSSHPGREAADPRMFQQLTRLPRPAPTGQEELKQAPNVPAVPKTKRPQSAPLARATDQGQSARRGASSRRTEGKLWTMGEMPQADGLVEVATRSQSSATPTFAHIPVVDAYKDEQYCMAHIPLNPQPNTVHRSELTNGKIKRVSPMLKVLKECPNPRKYFDPDKFLEALQLDSLLPRKEVDTSLYVTNRAKLEQMYPYLLGGQKDAVAGVVYSTLKYLVSEEEEARAVRDKFAVNLRIGWNALKDCLAIRYVNVERLAQKLLPHEFIAEWKEKDNWQGIVVELRYFLKLKAERHLTRPRVVHALLVTGGDVEFINDVMSAGLSLPRNNPTLPEIQEFLSGIQEQVVFDKVFTEIVESLKVAGEWGLANELQESGATKSNPMHLFGVWLATAAATTRPATWADFVQLLRKAGVDEGVVQTVPGGPWDSHQSDVFHISVGQQPPVTAQAMQELSTKQVDQPRAWNERMLASANEWNRDIEDVNAKHSARSSADQPSSDSADKSKFYIGPPSSSNVDARSQGVGVPSKSGSAARRQPSQAPHTNQPVPLVTATTALSNREEEEHYLSLPLDPSDAKSILYHAKAVYLTLDYNNTQRILDILADHLLVDEEMLRAKVFGYAISYYRQRNFPPALERLDELEKLALEHHSAEDVSLSCIYRGEIYMAQKKLDQAFRMFDHARATYDENNVSTYYGIIILSKCAVMVKAAKCQEQLMDYRKAKEVYHMAIDFAERVRLTKEALPLDEPDRKNKVEAAYRDEITARCSLGNLFQNMSDCANALEQYKVVLHLQGKIEGCRVALGWAEGNYATNDEKNISMYCGIAIPSKYGVMVKAASCHKQLMDYQKAKEVYHMAIDFAERVRLTKEALPLDEPDRKNKVEAAYRDEITARCSLGDLFQNMSDCANALEQYKVVLHLQGKIKGDTTALGWAEGSNVSTYCGIAIPSNFEVMMNFLLMKMKAAYQYKLTARHSSHKIPQASDINDSDAIKAIALEVLRYCNEALSRSSDDTSLYTAYQNRASVYIILAATVTEGVGEWDEVPEDIVAEEPREVIGMQLPVEEQTKEVENFHRQHMVLPSGRTLPRGGLDDSEEYFKRKDGSPSQSEVLSGPGSSVPSAGDPPLPEGSSTRLGTSHTHYLRHRKFYLQKAEEDLRKVVNFVESKFATMKGKENADSFAIFEGNSKAFYGLQKVLVCLGRSQEALKIAEANRARNLGEVMLSAKKNSIFSLSNVKVPLDLSTIWSFANTEQTPVAVLSCDVSCILVHIIVPQDEQSALVLVGRYKRQQTFPSALLRGSEEAIPANCYHFFKIELFTDTFTDEWSRNREARPSSDNVTFEQYVTKNLMDFLNAKETNLFEPVDFEPRDNPLTVLFDQFARKFEEVIETTAPEFHELVVIADQALHLLSWPVLQDKTSRKFLGDRYRIRTYPSILTMGVISSQPAPVITLPLEEEERFLVVGNPAIPKFINQKKEISLGRLPHAEDEATQVSHILETKPLLREQATKQTVIYRLQKANLVHIATHGSGSQGYIALASNIPVLGSTNAVAVDAKECLLFIDEIQRLHIGAALVVLSACHTGTGVIDTEGVNSIARAILAAGAQSVLVSLVRVSDKSASIFMRLFYRFLVHDGMTTSKALQKSSMGVRCYRCFSQHWHWGGFQLIGRNIQIIYNTASNSAKVATLVGDPTPFPRLELLQQLEKAIFRNDRTPPRDVVLVKGMSFYDPAEVVRDFICKHFKHYPGGVFWYNAASEDLLDASVSFVKQTVPHLKTIQREPPVEKAIPDKKKKTLLDGSGGESYDNHYRLIVLDHPASMATCLAKIPEVHSSHSDVIVIHTADTDRDQSLRWVDKQLVRGCTPIVAGPLDKYDSIQRMAYSILRDSHITPYEEDYEAFDILQKFCHGSSSLVRLLEGMLCKEKPEMELRQLASDITRMQDMEPDVFTRPGHQDLPQTHPAAEEKGSSLFKRSSKSKDRARGEGKARNGYIHKTPELTAEDDVRLSNDHEKHARLVFPIGTLLKTRMAPEEHFLLTTLVYLTLYPKSHSEGTFTFTDQFLNQLATFITDANGKTTKAHSLVKKLEELHVIGQYPLPVLSPPYYESTFKLVYIPDSIVRAVTFDLDQADEAFILTACSSAVQHLSEPHPYNTALKKKVELLNDKSGLPSLQQ